MGTSAKIRLGILTSSRADFGIYLPLLKLIKQRSAEFEFKLIVFGSHLSKYHGFTKVDIERNGFEISYEVPSLLLTDDVSSIASGYALTALKFADFWKQHLNSFDWIICLGDRFEMAAAVAATIPFGLKIAHIHGGETTLGAIDNIYRHSITLASNLHFVSLDDFKIRICELAGRDAKCFVTGSLSLDNLDEISLLSKQEFIEKWGIPLDIPFVLVTLHPETIAFEKNQYFSDEVIRALKQILVTHNIVITLPNADTAGTILRTAFHHLKNENSSSVFLIENFGTQSYFSCMEYADYMIGNTSSGIVEAASFKKYVINVGDRQKGRLSGINVINVPFDHKQIVEKAYELSGKKYLGNNIYKINKAAPIILDALKINTHNGL